MFHRFEEIEEIYWNDREIARMPQKIVRLQFRLLKIVRACNVRA